MAIAVSTNPGSINISADKLKKMKALPAIMFANSNALHTPLKKKNIKSAKGNPKKTANKLPKNQSGNYGQ